jgi:hypothetical protein
MQMGKNIGIVNCCSFGHNSQLQGLIHQNQYRVSRVCVKDEASLRFCQTTFPDAEVGYKKEALMEDQAISLVILIGAGPDDYATISDFIKADKKVQVLAN